MSQKRSAEEEVIPAQRYIRIKLASPSPEKSGGSDTESIHSCQGYETELVRDTSDTSSSPTYNIEYEVTDAEEPKHNFYLSDDSDDEELELDSVFGGVSSDNLDIALLGDTSEENSTSPTSNSDVDPGLPRNDYLDFEKCLLCKTKEKDISYPYCSKCFTWKKNFFPRRPKKQGTIKKDKSQPKNSSKSNHNLSIQNTQRTTCIKIKNGDDEKGNNENSNNENQIDLLRQKNNKDCNVGEGLCEDSGLGSSGPQLSEDVVDGPSTSSQEPSTSSPNSRGIILDTCRVCFLKPENGLFVHLNGTHVYGCYSCAKKIWYNNQGCPICRRKIFKVSKLYV